MYFFQSSPVSYKRFIKRFPTENSLIKLYAKTCVDFDIESKPQKRRCPHCGSCQNGPFRKNNEKLRLCKRCGRTFSSSKIITIEYKSFTHYLVQI